jgi:hypothetical protein
MEIDELNSYLSKLTGPGLVQRLDVTEHSEGGTLILRFCGDTGSIDNGEIELAFSCVDVLNLPLSSLMAPVSITKASPLETAEKLNVNYQDDGYALYIIKDSENIEWYVYAKSYSVDVLPIFYGAKI